MKILYIIIILVIFIRNSSFPQNRTIIGIVTIQNSNTKPLPDAYITSPGANPKFSLADGTFKLTYADKVPGDAVQISVFKEGFEVVNDEALFTKLTSDEFDTLKIWVCPVGEKNKRKIELYQISTKYITEKYAKVIYDLKRAKKATYDTLSKLALEKQAMMKVADELSQKLSVINLDYNDFLYRKAFLFFKKGLMDSAISILNDKVLDQQLEKATIEISQSKELDSLANLKRVRGKLLKNQTIKEILLKAKLYEQSLEFRNAKSNYVKAVQADTTVYESLFSLASFYSNRRNIDSAIFWFDLALPKSPSYREAIFILTAFGGLYLETMDLEKSENYLRQALNLTLENGRTLPSIFEPYLPEIYADMASIFSKRGINDSALIYYRYALNVYKKYDSQLSTNEVLLLPSILNNYAAFCSDLRKLHEAEDIYQEGLRILREREAENKNVWTEAMIGIMLNNLGNAYISGHSISLAKQTYLSAFDTFSKLIVSDSEFYSIEFAISCYKLMIIYMHDEYYTVAKRYATKALHYFESFSGTSSFWKESGYSNFLTDLAALYNRTNEYQTSLKFLKEKSSIDSKLYSQYPLSYTKEKTKTLGLLAGAYASLNKKDSAYQCIDSAILLISKSDYKNMHGESYFEVAVFTYYMAGSVHFMSRDYSKAFEMFEFGLNFYDIKGIDSLTKDFSYYDLVTKTAAAYASEYKLTKKIELKQKALSLLNIAESGMTSMLKENDTSTFYERLIDDDIKQISFMKNYIGF